MERIESQVEKSTSPTESSFKPFYSVILATFQSQASLFILPSHSETRIDNKFTTFSSKSKVTNQNFPTFNNLLGLFRKYWFGQCLKYVGAASPISCVLMNGKWQAKTRLDDRNKNGERNIVFVHIFDREYWSSKIFD